MHIQLTTLCSSLFFFSCSKMTHRGVSPNSLMTRFDEWFGSLTTDPVRTLTNAPIKTIGLVGAGIVLTVLIIDLLGYLIAYVSGKKSSYVPFSRNAIDKITSFWDNRHSNMIGDYLDPYSRQSRSLDSMTEVLDSISAAWKKWGRNEDLEVRSRMPIHQGIVFSR